MRNLLFVLAFILSLSSFSQYEKGNIAADVYYGTPSIWRGIMRLAYENDGNYENVSVGGIGPLGTKVEYYFNDVISLGLHMNFTSATLEGTDIYQTNVNGSTQTVSENFRFSFLVYRIMAIGAYNAEISDNMYAYLSGGFGFASTIFNLESDSENFQETSFDAGFLPVAIRSEIGIRYFFNESINISAFGGLGAGALVGLGFGVKL